MLDYGIDTIVSSGLTKVLCNKTGTNPFNKLFASEKVTINYKKIFFINITL